MFTFLHAADLHLDAPVAAVTGRHLPAATVEALRARRSWPGTRSSTPPSPTASTSWCWPAASTPGPSTACGPSSASATGWPGSTPPASGRSWCSATTTPPLRVDRHRRLARGHPRLRRLAAHRPAGRVGHLRGRWGDRHHPRREQPGPGPARRHRGPLPPSPARGSTSGCCTWATAPAACRSPSSPAAASATGRSAAPAPPRSTPASPGSSSPAPCRAATPNQPTGADRAPSW